jgi:hypothetical protein
MSYLHEYYNYLTEYILKMLTTMPKHIVFLMNESILYYYLVIEFKSFEEYPNN